MHSNIPFRYLLHYLRGQIIPKKNCNFIFYIPFCLKLVCNCRRHKLWLIIIIIIIIRYLQYIATYLGHFQPKLNIKLKTILHVTNTLSGPGSSVGIATDYGLGGPESNPGGEEFSVRPDRTKGHPSLLYNGYWVFTGSTGGRGVGLTPTPSSAESPRKE